MTKEEIKKELYKQKPIADLMYVKSGSAYYVAQVNDVTVHFTVPVSDMGEARFEASMNAQLLNRWISNF